MTNVLTPSPKQQFFNNAGQPNANGYVYTYAAGTSTPIATYTSSGLTNTNPIVLNSRGECDLWLLPNVGYKYVLTDPSGNQIWSVDNIVNSQLLTLFGGTDTGAANFYLLNFTANFTSITNGIVLYWVPSNNNTGASTINVNGLGVIPIVNQNGSALGANQIVAGQMTQIVYYANTPNPLGGTQAAWQLVSLGNFTGNTIGTFGPYTPIASNTTTDLGSAAAHTVVITGTNTINNFGSSASTLAPIYIVYFQSSLTITYSSQILLPGAGNLVTQPGDALIAGYAGGGVWRVLLYQSSTGATPLTRIKPADTVITSSATIVIDPDLQTSTLAIGRYSYNAFLAFDSAVSTAGFKWVNVGTAVDSRTNYPAIANGVVNGSTTTAIVSPYNTTIAYTTVATTADSNVINVNGSLLLNAAGTFAIGWAQNASNAAATTLRAGSYLNLSLVNTGSTNNTLQHVYTTAGTFTETVPNGYNTLTIECWGGTGGGGNGWNGTIGSGLQSGGGGGGSGAYSRSDVTVTGLGGDTLSYTVASATGSSSVSSGTLSIATMTSPGGSNGATATNVVGGAGGAGGTTATGGTVINVTGTNGYAGSSSYGGAGAAGIPGIFSSGANGAMGTYGNSGGSTGNNGVVAFTYM